MARKKHENPAAEALDELESLGDRLAQWVSENPALILGSVLGVLVIAGGYGFYASSRDRGLDRASAELARVESDYRDAMGASPDNYEIPEPANAAAARATREQFLPQFEEVAASHAGTAVGALAALEAGNLRYALGDPDAALASWRGAADVTPAGEIARAVLLRRIADAEEAAGRWPEAAEAHGEAASVEAYPLRYAALADAARCYAEAGDEERALAAFDRLETEAPEARVPPHIRARLSELRAARESG